MPGLQCRHALCGKINHIVVVQTNRWREKSCQPVPPWCDTRPVFFLYWFRVHDRHNNSGWAVAFCIRYQHYSVEWQTLNYTTLSLIQWGKGPPFSSPLRWSSDEQTAKLRHHVILIHPYSFSPLLRSKLDQRAAPKLIFLLKTPVILAWILDWMVYKTSSHFFLVDVDLTILTLFSWNIAGASYATFRAVSLMALPITMGQVHKFLV